MRSMMIACALSLSFGCASAPDATGANGGAYGSLREATDYHARETLSALSASRGYRVAVLPLEQSGADEDAELGYILQDEMISSLLRLRPENVAIYERQNLNDVVAESRLALSGMISEASAAELGELVGANAVLIGSVRKAGSSSHLSTRLVDAGTAEILASATSPLPASLIDRRGDGQAAAPDASSTPARRGGPDVLDKDFTVTDLSLNFEIEEQQRVRRITTTDGVWREYNNAGEEIGAGRVRDLEDGSFEVEWTYVPGRPAQVGGRTRYEYHLSGEHLFVRIIVDGYQIGYLEMRGS
jgi:TolB-like protein